MEARFHPAHEQEYPKMTDYRPHSDQKRDIYVALSIFGAVVATITWLLYLGLS